MPVKLVLLAAGIFFGSATAASAQSILEQGFAGALKGCEEWVLNPASWVDGPEPFVRSLALGDSLGLVSHVDDAALPPSALRHGNHFWRINSTPTSGFILVVSDSLPMCHITGGGDVDMQPVVMVVLGSATFAEHWQEMKTEVEGDMITTTYRNRFEPKFTIIISRAKSAGDRFDRVQIIATATFNLNA